MAERDPKGTGGSDNSPVTFRVGHHELVVRRRYEVLSIVNDMMIGVWFAVGSVFFFYTATETAGIWLFLIGSVQLLIRPIIRLTRNVHLKRITHSPTSVLMGSSHDF